ncbi:uroporphyrinogen-III C-methyltransferase [Alkalihalophilus pseudofirmus]|uniref:uroporphyrinogen-III C-methyltransferase n=1 Tax=Alkalihalophilus pseudofirmus TaxID=79885 RepID=UPI00259B8039|nr:uroporphyrinogen-III C-methyltransferase [Alkalihalophilus pseudofirmus]WEG16554.1 uroporphyrinogen-III C-methyltransferase [Alkalihalophilus pseudofirmus]
MNSGIVYFVGAGPGDKDLLTLKGLRALREADVVVYDRLVNPVLLTETKESAKLIYCGKQPCKHTLRQEDIQKELLIHARKGKKVVRLKGGDPAVFGRVGEEAELLADNHVPYEIIPGITAGIAATMYAGVPITHREHSGSFAVVTGHTKTSDGKPDVEWKSLAEGVSTIVFYMGVKHIRTIASELISHGKYADTPVMVSQWGTYSRQQTITGTLATIANLVEGQIQNPAIIVVGEVVKLRSKLNWFDNRMLHGKGILMPTSTIEEKEEAQHLRKLGADVYEHPKLTEYSTCLDNEVFKDIEHYEEIVFYSPKAVQAFLKEVGEREMDLRTLNACFYAKDDVTKTALRNAGHLVQEWMGTHEWKRALVIGSEIELDQSFPLQATKWVIAEQRVTNGEVTALSRLLEEGHVNTLMITSEYKAQKLVAFFKLTGQSPAEWSDKLRVICRGTAASKRLAEINLMPDHVLEEESTSEEIALTLLDNDALAKGS